MSRFADNSIDPGPALEDPSSESRSLLACFLDGMADIAYLKDLDGRYAVLNKSAAAFFGRQGGEIIGLRDADLFPQEIAQRIAEQDRETLESGIPQTFEDEFAGPDGSRFFETVKSPCRGSSGELLGLIGTAREITQRKQLEESLRLRERELNQAQRMAKIDTWSYDCASGITTWSEGIYELYGMDPSQPALLYSEFRQRNDHTAADRRFIVAFERLIQTGEPYVLDIEILREDGTSRWVLAHGEVDRWKDGKVATLRGTVQEITDRKRSEREMALRESRYRSLVQATSQIVWSSNAAGDQLGNIPDWQAFTGQSEQQVLGLGWAAAIHPEDRERTVHEWQSCVRTGNTFVVEHRLLRSDGVYRDMAVRAVPVRDEFGEIVEWVGTHTDITEQKLAEQESELARARLQDVLDSITDGLCVLDHDWRYTYFNESGARMLGLRPADIIGKTRGDIFPENKTNAFSRAYQGAVDTGEAIHLEEYYGPPLNRWFEGNCYPSAHGLTVYFRDVTSRKCTEKALRDSESRFRKLFDSSLMGICIPDRFGGFKEGNDELLRITGYSRADLEAGLVRWDTMTPPEYAEIDVAHIQEAARLGSCTPYEKEYIRKDGSRVPILCGYALLDGSEDEYIGFVFDLTSQRQAEAELREREQRFRLLAEGLPELVWISDAAGSLLYLNSRFLDYCGIAADAMVAFDWQLILHPEEVERVNEAWSQSVRTGEAYLIELRMRCHDGSFRYFLARALPLLNAAGQVERWVGSCTDIHDRRLAEEALRRSEKLAATGRLAASIAHEINNPLASVVNLLYLVKRDTGLTAEGRTLLETAEEELARVTHITTQTLRFHRQSKAPALADIGDIMQSVLMLFQRRLAARQIEIIPEIQLCTRIWCREDELRQVFANLLSNALDATPGSGRLRVRVRRLRESGVEGVRVSVADTGCGIPPAIQSRIFEPFFSTKDATGIGLGLWVSEGIVNKHNARLSLRSSVRPDRHGTVFSIFFPPDGAR